MKQLPVWRVMVTSGDTIRPYNVFSHARFFESVCELAATYRKAMRSDSPTIFSVDKWDPGIGTTVLNLSPRDYLSYKLRGDALYYFWSKCEWEIVVSTWPTEQGANKIDVFTQLRMNWDNFLDYIIVHVARFPPTRNKELINKMLTNYRTEHREEDFDVYRL